MGRLRLINTTHLMSVVGRISGLMQAKQLECLA